MFSVGFNNAGIAMKNAMRLCIVLTFVPAVLNAGFKVEFDGKNPTQGIQAFIGGRLSVSPPVPADSSESFMRREILTETGEWVELKPIQSWVAPDGRIDSEYSIKPGAKLRRTFKCPRRTSSLQETYSLQNSAGGHFHSEIPSPLLNVSSPSLNASIAVFQPTPSPMIWSIYGGTTYYYWEQMPFFSTMIIEDLYSNICGQWTDILYVEIPGLNRMPTGTDYVLYNSEDGEKNHPDNHFGTPALINTIKAVASEYKTAAPDAEPLQIGDMSLFTGGVFDIKHDWTVPHTGHALGTDADIGKNVVPRANREKLLKILCKHVSETFLDPDLSGFYHINVPVGPTTGKDIFGQAVRCCVGNEIDPNNIMACTAD